MRTRGAVSRLQRTAASRKRLVERCAIDEHRHGRRFGDRKAPRAASNIRRATPRGSAQTAARSVRPPRCSAVPGARCPNAISAQAATPLPDGVALSDPGLRAVEQIFVVVAREEKPPCTASSNRASKRVAQVLAPNRNPPAGTASASVRASAARTETRSRRDSRSGRRDRESRVASRRPSRQAVRFSASAAANAQLGPARLVLRPRRRARGRDRQRVPRRQDLVVAAGVNALLALRKQRGLRAV